MNRTISDQYISSGDEGFDNRPLKIYRFNSQGEKKSEKRIITTSVRKHEMEIEGIHIVGNELQFLLVESSYIHGKPREDYNKQYQYIVNIDKDFLS